MKLRFTFKHMNSSNALMEVAESKFSNLVKRFKPGPREVRVTFDVDGAVKRMHASLVTSDGQNLEATETGENAYSLIDLVVHKLDGQLRRYKERRKVHKGEGLRTVMKAHAIEGRRGEFASGTGTGFWTQTPIDAADILSLSPSARGPLEPVCAG